MSGPWEKYQAAPDQASAAAPAPAADGPWTRYATPSAAASAKSDSRSQGESMPGIVKGAISTLQGPAMGFADELAGVGGAITGAIANLTPYGDGKSFTQNYRDTRDAARAASDSHMKENPVLGHVERIAASLPVIAATPVIQGVQKGGSFLSAVPESIKAGVKFGAIAGAGDSTATDVAGIAKDSAASAAAGGVLGPIVSGIVRGGSAVASNIGQQIASSPTGRTMLDTIKEMGVSGHGGGGIVSAALPSADGGSRKFAMQKIAEAVERDKPGLTNPLDIIAARQNRLGVEATIADSAGQNAKQLLDTLATLPGQTKDAAERLIHSRQATRADRLIGAAEAGLSPNGARLPQTLEALDEARQQAAGPLYDRIRQTTLAVDPVLESLLERSSNAFGVAKRLAEVNGQKFNLLEGNPGVDALLLPRQKVAPLSQLDTLKRTLYDVEQSHVNPETGRLNELGAAYRDLRRELVAKIDNLTTDPKTGESFYKAARDAYAGPSELRAAANLGNQAMSKDAWKIGQMTDGMSASELEAFRIGAFESLRKKFGTEGGQTQIMKMWKEPATSEKLKELFDDQAAFRRFAADVAKEARLKGLESVGRGSQTAARAAGMGDVDMAAVTEAGNIARSAATGNVPGMLGSATNLWNRVKTPEAVRDQMGEILMAKGQQGAQNISEIKRIAEQIKQEKARRAAQAGTFAGLL
ncbi:MAG: hypothetical protein ABTQ26_11840 [Azonexus sp.]